MFKNLPLYLAIFAVVVVVISLIFGIRSNAALDRQMADLRAMATQNAESYNRVVTAERNIQETICNEQAGFVWKDPQGFANINIGLLKDCKDHMSADLYQKYMNAVLEAGRTHGFDFTSDSPFTVEYQGFTHSSSEKILHSDNLPDMTIQVFDGSYLGFQTISFDCGSVGVANQIVICE